MWPRNGIFNCIWFRFSLGGHVWLSRHHIGQHRAERENSAQPSARCRRLSSTPSGLWRPREFIYNRWEELRRHFSLVKIMVKNIRVGSWSFLQLTFRDQQKESLQDANLVWLGKWPLLKVLNSIFFFSLRVTLNESWQGPLLDMIWASLLKRGWWWWGMQIYCLTTKKKNLKYRNLFLMFLITSDTQHFKATMSYCTLWKIEV